jgi:hypothetical protein
MFPTNIWRVRVEMGYDETDLSLHFDFYDILFLDIDYLI